MFHLKYFLIIFLEISLCSHCESFVLNIGNVKHLTLFIGSDSNVLKNSEDFNKIYQNFKSDRIYFGIRIIEGSKGLKSGNWAKLVPMSNRLYVLIDYEKEMRKIIYVRYEIWCIVLLETRNYKSFWNEWNNLNHKYILQRVIFFYER